VFVLNEFHSYLLHIVGVTTLNSFILGMITEVYVFFCYSTIFIINAHTPTIILNSIIKFLVFAESPAGRIRYCKYYCKSHLPEDTLYYHNLLQHDSIFNVQKEMSVGSKQLIQFLLKKV
jgi:hypothetical protein